MEKKFSIFVAQALVMVERFVNAPEKTAHDAELALKALRISEAGKLPPESSVPLKEAERALIAFLDAGAPATLVEATVGACRRTMEVLGWEDQGRGRETPAIDRDVLFGAQPLVAAASSAPIRDAATLLQTGRRAEAISALRALARGSESRLRAQAWHLLREQNASPDEAEAGEILGVIVEVAFPNGKSDVVAAFGDHRARYWNYSGRGIVWEMPAGTDKTVDEAVTRMIDAAGRLVALEPRVVSVPPASPSTPDVRITVITPRGFHTVLGPFAILGSLRTSPVPAAALGAAQILMVRLMDLSRGGATRPR